ncbi:MAG: transposase [Eubacteriales bacterium]|nr:transposase [Clostridiales bacterium]MDY5710489.1 transposase [Eubacteriales bacterium]MDY5801677.1 transposase [Eubacteriales bacterium]
MSHTVWHTQSRSISAHSICPDYVHLLLRMSPKLSISGLIGFLKSKSTLMIFQRYGNMKFAYPQDPFMGSR